MSGTVVQEMIAAMRAAHDALAACDLDLLTLPELQAVGDELETLTCQLPTQSHRLLARLQAEATPKEMGAKSWKDVLTTRWRISTSEANRRLTEAAPLGPRRALTGHRIGSGSVSRPPCGLPGAADHVDRARLYRSCIGRNAPSKPPFHR